MPRPRDLVTLTTLPLKGKAPRKLAAFPKKPPPGTVATVRRQLQSAARTVLPPAVPRQTFRIRGQLLTAAGVASIARVARSDNPGEQLIKKEKWSLEQLTGAIYTAMVVQQYKETKTQYEQALRQARRLALPLRRNASDSIEAGFRDTTGSLIAAMKRGGITIDQRGLEKQAEILSASRTDYQAVLDMRGSATVVQAAAPRTLLATVVPTTVSQILTDRPFGDLQVPVDWCGFAPIEGSQSKHFSASFALKTTFSYPCGIKWCKKWGVPYPCGTKWCDATVTWAAGSVALSLAVGYKIGCCGGTAWGGGEVEACGTVLNQTLCAGCAAVVTGVIGAATVSSSAGMCVYGLGLNASVTCELAGYTVFAASYQFGWVIQAPCPPAGLCK